MRPESANALYAEEFYRGLPWQTRVKPTAEIPARERALVKRLVREEERELQSAIDRADLEGIADSLADLVYVVYGAARHFGIDLDRVIAEVHRANMSKLGPEQIFELDSAGKVERGERYRPPDIKRALAAG